MMTCRFSSLCLIALLINLLGSNCQKSFTKDHADDEHRMARTLIAMSNIQSDGGSNIQQHEETHQAIGSEKRQTSQEYFTENISQQQQQQQQREPKYIEQPGLLTFLERSRQTRNSEESSTIGSEKQPQDAHERYDLEDNKPSQISFSRGSSKTNKNHSTETISKYGPNSPRPRNGPIGSTNEDESNEPDSSKYTKKSNGSREMGSERKPRNAQEECDESDSDECNDEEVEITIQVIGSDCNETTVETEGTEIEVHVEIEDDDC